LLQIKNVTQTILVLAMGVGTLCIAGCAQGHIQIGPNQLQVVVYANRDISAGTMIRAAAVEEKKIKNSQIPQGAVPSGMQAVGRIASVDIESGEFVSLCQLEPQGSLKYQHDNLEGEKEWKAAMAKFDKSVDHERPSTQAAGRW
jgi:Flp pilus assembly protein CpaB